MSAPIKRVCPTCGAELVLRTNRKTETKFYGCERFPDCTYTMEIPAYEHMRRAGVPPLPGFE